jgi:phage shock protein A
MTLMTRFARLFRADLHAVLDRVEEPDVLLRQAVREMEEELARDASALRLLEQEHRRMDAREAELQQALVALEEQLGVCLDAGKEDLARPVMRRKLETRKGLELLIRRHEALGARISQARLRLDENRGAYESLRQKAELLIEEAAGTRQPDDWSRLDVAVRDEDVEVALLREKQRRARP